MFEDSPLEVILVNSRSGEAPEKAQAIAQASLAGGGEAASGRATSPLPPSALTEIGDANEETRKQIEQLQQTQQQLLTQVRRELALLPPTDPLREQGTPDEREQEDRRRQLVEMLAEIEKRINEENARPKKRYISPATREEVYALYYDQLRRKIEDRGTRNFPENQGKKLYGELTMVISVDAEGRVLDTEIVRGSGNKVLDRRAVAIVQRGRALRPLQRGDAQAGRPARDSLALSLHARGGPRNDAERRGERARRAAMRWSAIRSRTASRRSSTPRSRRRPARRCATTGCSARSTASPRRCASSRPAARAAAT